MAQAVAHLIGSEEVPGPSPGASWMTKDDKGTFRLSSFVLLIKDNIL